MTKELTGKKRFRSTWRGKLVLQVEETWKRASAGDPPGKMETVKDWRDARAEDFHHVVPSLNLRLDLEP